MNIADITTKELEQWLSQPIGHVNGNEVAVRVMQDVKNPFHCHEDSDEMFIILNGTLYLDTEQETITVTTGQSYTVHAGVSHRARAESRVELIAIIKSNQHELV